MWHIYSLLLIITLSKTESASFKYLVRSLLPNTFFSRIYLWQFVVFELKRCIILIRPVSSFYGQELCNESFMAAFDTQKGDFAMS